MLKRVVKFKALLPFLGIILYSYTVQATWLDELATGKDKAAGRQLMEWTERLAQSSADPGLILELKNTASYLQQDLAICPEEAKIIVFRGVRTTGSEITDRNFGTEKNPLFAAKIFRTNNGRALSAEKLKSIKDEVFVEKMFDHSSHYNVNDSPVISTTYSPYVATLSPEVFVLKLCPQRLTVNPSRFGAEYETLIPFFIHSSEILAVLEIERSGTGGQRSANYPLNNNKYSILSKYNEFGSWRETKIRNYIQAVAQDHQKFVREDRNFRKAFERILRKKLRLAGVDPDDDPYQDEKAAKANPSNDEIAKFLTDRKLLKAQFKYELEDMGDDLIDRGLTILKGLEPYAKDDVDLQIFLAKVASETLFPNQTLYRMWCDQAFKILKKMKPTSERVLKLVPELRAKTCGEHLAKKAA